MIGVGTQSPLATVHISASDGLIIPVGNTSQRSSDAIRGEIRFNTQLQSYEGYDGANWGTLGGMNDVDNDTKITAENSALFSGIVSLLINNLETCCDIFFWLYDL